MDVVLKDVYDRKNNSFDDLRFILATLVVFYHSYELIAVPEHDFISSTILGQSSLGGIAVYSFFAISGFFMIQSLENSKTVIRYFRNRFYRIIPAFWFSLILFSLFIIPLFSNISFHGEGGSLDFILKSGTFHIFGYDWTIHNAFPNNTFVDGINGSMWTLKHELAAYILLPVFYMLSYKNRKIMLLFTLILFFLYLLADSKIFLFYLPVGTAWVLSENEYPAFILFLYYFMAGSCLYLYRDKILLQSRAEQSRAEQSRAEQSRAEQSRAEQIDYRWILFLTILLVFSVMGNTLKYILLIWIPYIIILLGCCLKYKLFSKFGDYSYGMYIYSFPIQQLVLLNYKDISAINLFLVSMFFTLLLSIFSYHLLEKPILNLKR